MRAELRRLTIRTSHSARGAQRTARPTFFCDWRFKSVPLRSPHGFARPQKVTSHHSAVGGRGKLVLYHHQLRPAGQKPTLPRRNWRCPARRHEIQPRAIELALPLVRAYADHLQAIIAFARDPGMQTNGPQGGDGIALARNSIGHVFVGTQGGGGFRSTDNGESWIEINNGLTATNVRALADQCERSHFAGTFAGGSAGGIFRSGRDGDSLDAGNNGLGCGTLASLAINPGSDVFVELPVAATVFTVRPTTGQLELAHTGLTSTDVVALAMNSTDARVLCRNLFSHG